MSTDAAVFERPALTVTVTFIFLSNPRVYAIEKSAIKGFSADFVL